MTALFLLFACTSSGDGGGECVDNGECDEGQACVDSTCVSVACLDSDECDIGQFCNPRNYTCVAGCENDGDCLAGQDCNTQTHECVDSACRTAELDCSVGESCDSVTGQCYEFQGSICDQRCDSSDQWSNGGCNQNATCETFITDWDGCKNNNECDAGSTCTEFIVAEGCSNNSQCPSGAVCDSFWGYCTMGLCHEDFCMPVCNPNQVDSCPAGFSCYSDGLGGGTCYGECTYYLENGYL